MKRFLTGMINRLVRSTRLRSVAEAAQFNGKGLQSDEYDLVETLTVLKKIYVHKNHALAAQRYGQRSVIRSLFKVYFREVIGKRPKLLPPFYADLARDLRR